jgi:hypothetical protein
MIHVIIKQERRTAPRELAISIQNSQLHTMGAVINDPSNIVYAAEWDGMSPWINVLKNELEDSINMAYAGWPMVTKEEYEALNPPSNPV